MRYSYKWPFRKCFELKTLYLFGWSINSVYRSSEGPSDKVIKSSDPWTYISLCILTNTRAICEVAKGCLQKVDSLPPKISDLSRNDYWLAYFGTVMQPKAKNGCTLLKVTVSLVWVTGIGDHLSSIAILWSVKRHPKRLDTSPRRMMPN